MKVIIPHSERNSSYLTVHLAIRSCGIVARTILLRGIDDYHALLLKLWSEKESFIIVEQDVIPTPEMIHELWNCKHEWCGARYLIAGGYMIQPLGCTKFSAKMIEACPRMIEKLPHKRWYSLDGDIFTAGHDQAKMKLHGHGKVIHLNQKHFPEVA